MCLLYSYWKGGMGHKREGCVLSWHSSHFKRDTWRRDSGMIYFSRQAHIRIDPFHLCLTLNLALVHCLLVGHVLVGHELGQNQSTILIFEW